MSQENVEIVRRSTEVFNESAAAVISQGFFAPEVVLDFSRTGIPGLGAYLGYDEIQAFFEGDWFAAFPFEEWEVEIEELIDHDEDRVISFSDQRGRGGSSLAATQLAFACIWTLRDGEIVRGDFFLDRDKALEAAGPSE
jgi:ketosteroid isomerase-like protein